MREEMDRQVRIITAVRDDEIGPCLVRVRAMLTALQASTS